VGALGALDPSGLVGVVGIVVDSSMFMGTKVQEPRFL
jgi:hypothetical protein